MQNYSKGQLNQCVTAQKLETRVFILFRGARRYRIGKILRDHIATEDKVYIGRGGERDYKKGKIAELATITYK